MTDEILTNTKGSTGSNVAALKTEPENKNEAAPLRAVAARGDK
jgi:hypothetical protein